MPRKKEKILSLEVIETNSTWDYRETKVLNNFICKKDDAEKTVVDMDRREFWKHEASFKDQVKSILSDPGTRNHSDVFFNDDVNVEEVKLPASVKAGTKYVYNGTRQKIEYSPKAVTDILNELEETTSQFAIESVGRSDTTDNSLLVTMFKNCIK